MELKVTEEWAAENVDYGVSSAGTFTAGAALFEEIPPWGEYQPGELGEVL